MQEKNEPTPAEDLCFREHDVGVIAVTYPEPANITLRGRFTNVHPDFGNRVISREHVYDEWPASVAVFLLECTREVTSREVKQALRGRKSGGAAYEELLAYYDWWREAKPSPSWMILTVALDSGMLGEYEGKSYVSLVPGMVRNPNWFNFPDLWLFPEKGPWPPKTRFLAVRGRGFEP